MQSLYIKSMHKGNPLTDSKYSHVFNPLSRKSPAFVFPMNMQIHLGIWLNHASAEILEACFLGSNGKKIHL